MQQVTKNPELKKLILDLNRIDQLFERGINSEGQSLGEYAQSTIIGTAKFKGKIEKGQPTDRVTLKDTGEYYESFDLLFNNDTIEFTSQDNYDLIGRYKEHLGLTTDNLQEAIQYIRAFILQQIREQILIQ
jgi:transcription initiation factor TFIIIB Brf1 subunit/transcription initiation factor TFIIB